jgi:hypothetical protein
MMEGYVKNAAFDDFVKSQQSPPEPEVDWKQVRNEWLRRLDELYKQVEGFLSNYIASGQIVVESHPIDLTEENLGTYKARKLVLRIGRSAVTLMPVGTLLIGSRGRVDVIGPRGTTVPILLINSKARQVSDMVRVQVSIGRKLPDVPKEKPGEITWEWKMVTRPPERRFIELTQESFFGMIMEVANG